MISVQTDILGESKRPKVRRAAFKATLVEVLILGGDVGATTDHDRDPHLLLEKKFLRVILFAPVE